MNFNTVDHKGNWPHNWNGPSRKTSKIVTSNSLSWWHAYICLVSLPVTTDNIEKVGCSFAMWKLIWLQPRCSVNAFFFLQFYFLVFKLSEFFSTGNMYCSYLHTSSKTLLCVRNLLKIYPANIWTIWIGQEIAQTRSQVSVIDYWQKIELIIVLENISVLWFKESFL